MKKLILGSLIFLLPFSSLSAEEDISELAKNTDALYRTGAGAKDGCFTALASSMYVWGFVLAVGIAVLAAVLHQSQSSGAPRL
ncbi:MAG TPA: hypothetical protein VIJ46_05560 [Rhabdochlamydiaceae bacterium]